MVSDGFASISAACVSAVGAEVRSGSSKTLPAGGAPQVFRPVSGVPEGQALGAQLGALVGAKSGRALSHGC